MKKSQIFAGLILGLVGGIASVPAFADSVLYDNTGPLSYVTDAYGIGGNEGIGDSFTLSQNSTVTGVNFVEWASTPGVTPTTVDWSISTDPFSGYLASGTATLTGPSVSTGIFSESLSVPDLSLAAGTYWLELYNAQDSGADRAEYWDWSGGASLAAVAQGGSFTGILTPSETFQILGTTATPEPSSFLLLASGLAGLAGMIKRKMMA